MSDRDSSHSNPVNRMSPLCSRCGHRFARLIEAGNGRTCWACASRRERDSGTSVSTGYKMTWEEINNVPAPKILS